MSCNDAVRFPGPEDDWVRLDDPRKAVVASLMTLIEEHRDADFKITMTGLPYVDYQVDVLTEQETGFFGLMALLAAVYAGVVPSEEAFAGFSNPAVITREMRLLVQTTAWIRRNTWPGKRP